MHDDDRPADPSWLERYDEPLDLAALRADDEFIESLIGGPAPRSGAALGSSPVDDELAAMLTAWASEVRPETVPAPQAVPASYPLVGYDDAPAAISPATPRMGRHRRVPVARYGRFAAAAAVMVLAASGLGVGAWESQPGQVLFPVAKVVFAERAASMQAAADVTSSLAVARSAISRGDTSAAASALAAAQARIGAVRGSEGHDELALASKQLIGELPPGALDAAMSLPTPVPTGSPSPLGPPLIAAGGATSEPARAAVPVPATTAPAPPAASTPDPVADEPADPVTEPTLGSDAPADPPPVQDPDPVTPTPDPVTTDPTTEPAAPPTEVTTVPEPPAGAQQSVTDEPVSDDPTETSAPDEPTATTDPATTEPATTAPETTDRSSDDDDTTTTPPPPPADQDDAASHHSGPIRDVLGIVGGTVNGAVDSLLGSGSGS